jgi:hypothetical protein
VSGGERERGSEEGNRERGALERDIYRERVKGESGGLREREGEEGREIVREVRGERETQN